MKKINPANFVYQVRQEMSKVSWASRKETVTSTIMVMVMVAIASVFFLLADMVIFNGVQLVLGIGS